MVIINWLAVFLAAVASFILGWLWYGPIFGKTWCKEHNIKPNKDMKMPVMNLVYNFITNFILALTLYILYLNVAMPVAYLILLVWVGFFMMPRITSMIWMPSSTVIFAIDMFHHLVNLIIMILIFNVI